MPLSLPDIEAILNGNSVLGLSLNDMLKVKSYNKAVEELYLNIRDKIFVADKYDLIDLHRIATEH